MKTGRHPMRTRLRLFLEWGITFEEPYTVPPRKDAQARYAGRKELLSSIMRKYELDKPKQGADGLSTEKRDMAADVTGIKL